MHGKMPVLQNNLLKKKRILWMNFSNRKKYILHGTMNGQLHLQIIIGNL